MKRNPFSKIVCVAAAALLPAGLATAQLATNVDVVPLAGGATDWTNSFVVPQINLPAAKLFGIVIDAEVIANISGSLNNTGPSPGLYSFQAGTTLNVVLPGGLLQPEALAPLASGTAQPLSSVPYGPFNGVTASLSGLYQGLSAAEFLGSGTIGIPVYTSSGGQTVGSANIVADVATAASATLTVNYIYYVPEPSVGALLLGGVGLLAWRWCRPAAQDGNPGRRRGAPSRPLSRRLLAKD